MCVEKFDVEVLKLSLTFPKQERWKWRMKTEQKNQYCRREFVRAAGSGMLGLFLPGCAALERIDRGLYDAHRSVTEKDLITGQRTISFHSRADQIARGNASMKRIMQKYDRLNSEVNSRSYNRLLGIFQRVHSASHFANESWEIVLLPEDGFNAFVTGGTYVAVYQGLMDEVQDDAAIAAVIGHEIGHVAANHVFEKQQLMIALVQIALKEGPAVGSDFAYSTLNENEADRIGIVYAALAGYDPYAVSKLWGNIARKSRDDWSWFRTHPAGSDRTRITRTIADKATQYYLPGILNPDHYNLSRCNALWCNK